MNVFSFLPLNITGDDENVFPYINYNEKRRLDVSRLAQWEILFEHADKLGMYLHFKTQEAENQLWLDNGDLGVERKLYYRELIARFSHHLALNWNLGEENGSWGEIQGQNTEQRLAMAQYFYDHDPYRHLVVVHNGQSFDDFLVKESKLTGLSVQTNQPDFSRVHVVLLAWISKSREAGKTWVISVDEPGDATHALVTDEEDPEHNNARKNALWGALMAGAAGIEWYFGYQHPHSDLTCQDWRSRDKMWDQCRYALEFFRAHNIPFWEMKNGNSLITSSGDYCFYKPNEIYLVYLKEGGSTHLQLGNQDGRYSVHWFNPRTGGDLLEGSKKILNGTGSQSIGNPPDEADSDWLALVRRVD
jgi:hypothetical protein